MAPRAEEPRDAEEVLVDEAIEAEPLVHVARSLVQAVSRACVEDISAEEEEEEGVFITQASQVSALEAVDAPPPASLAEAVEAAVTPVRAPVTATVPAVTTPPTAPQAASPPTVPTTAFQRPPCTPPTHRAGTPLSPSPLSPLYSMSPAAFLAGSPLAGGRPATTEVELTARCSLVELKIPREELRRLVNHRRLMQALVADQRAEVERVVALALMDLHGDLAGEYFPLQSSTTYRMRPRGMTDAEHIDLVRSAHGLLFAASDPNGRGVFMTSSRDAAVWVNKDHHVTFVAKLEQKAAVAKARRLEAALREAVKPMGYTLEAVV